MKLVSTKLILASLNTVELALFRCFEAVDCIHKNAFKAAISCKCSCEQKLTAQLIPKKA